MTRADIETRVLNTVAVQLGVALAELKLETSFVGDLGADSLDSVELCMAIEDEFELDIPDDDAVQLANPKQVVDWILKQPAFCA